TTTKSAKTQQERLSAAVEGADSSCLRDLTPGFSGWNRTYTKWTTVKGVCPLLLPHRRAL
ncbi:unnamed protein product, partial [Nesidiocoris tenuis]